MLINLLECPVFTQTIDPTINSPNKRPQYSLIRPPTDNLRATTLPNSALSRYSTQLLAAREMCGYPVVMTSTYNALEQEIIVLKAVWDMIDGMVNYANFEKGHRVVDAQLMFKTAEHQRLFNILLTDFLSKPEAGTFDLPDATGAVQSDRTFLFYLRRMCDQPMLNKDVSILRTPVDAFVHWLEEECLVEKVWLPSIDVQTDIRVKRIAFIKITGDIAKHNFARLSRNVERITTILADNGVVIPEGQGFLALPDFYEWFHRDL
jgi:hypothetical protein